MASHMATPCRLVVLQEGAACLQELVLPQRFHIVVPPEPGLGIAFLFCSTATRSTRP